MTLLAGPWDVPAAVADEAQAPKIIKRYSNRKLYDTARSKYVTLDEIAKMIKAGEEVTIIDNESKEDLTSVTLTQIIYEEEKRESRMPLAMLRNLIQTGGEALAEAQEAVRQSAIGLRDAATRSVNELTGSARRLFAERRADEFKKAFTAHMDALENRLQLRLDTLSEMAPQDDADDEKVDIQSAHKIPEHTQLLRERLAAINALVDDLSSRARVDD